MTRHGSAPTREMRDRPRIAVVGSYGTGLTMTLPRVPSAGETVSGATFSLGPGGKGSNQAVAAARLGAEAALLTAIGNDQFGNGARALWASEGVDDSAVVVKRSATMAGVILVEPDGENRIVVASGALDDLETADVDGFSAHIASADLMMVCNEIPARVVVRALQIAREHGVPTLFNPAPARELDPDAWGLVDYLTPNFGEGRVLAGLDSLAGAGAILNALRRGYSGTVVLTAGKEGAYVDGAEGGRSHVPAMMPPAVIDTTGAGDAFNAAFAVAICRGADPVEAARLAVVAGALAVSIAEVIPSLPTQDQINQFVRTIR